MDVRIRELERIENKLREYMPESEARRTTARIDALIVEVDKEISRILSDPLVGQMFEYDGKLFTPRGTQCFHRAFNGLNILTSLSDSSLECYFRFHTKHDAVEWLMSDLGSHIWEAKVRRLNWEDCGSLSCLTDEVIEELMRQVEQRRRMAALAAQSPAELTFEERSFFKAYENDLQCGCEPTDERCSEDRQ